MASAYVLMRCSCPDDHEVVAVYLDRDAARRAQERCDEQVPMPFAESGDFWGLYLKTVPLDPKLEATERLVQA